MTDRPAAAWTREDHERQIDRLVRCHADACRARDDGMRAILASMIAHHINASTEQPPAAGLTANLAASPDAPEPER